jgi:putative redox protein
MSLRATARRQGDSLRQEVRIGEHTIVTDEPEAWGGTGAGPSPQELLAASLASCTATTMAMYARYRDWDIGEIEVDVKYDGHAHPKRFAVTITLPDALEPERRERLLVAASRCMVRQTLEGDVVFEEAARSEATAR